MKKQVKTFLFVCLLSIANLQIAWAGDSRQIHLVFIGNSITYGATLGSPSTQAPPIRVGELIYRTINRPVKVSNQGISGITTFGYQPSRSAYQNVIKAADAFSQEDGPLYFSIMLGTNDSAESGTEGAPVAVSTYKTNMQNIINDLLKRYPNCRIVLNFPIWYSPNTHNGAVYLQTGLNRLKSYHPIIRTMVKEYATSHPGRVFAGSEEVFDYFENNTSLFTAESGNSGTFYLHPNASGARKLAEFWAESIMQLLDMDGMGRQERLDYLLLDSARTTIAQLYSATMNMKDALIVDAGSEGQLSSNAPGVGSVANLIDRSYASYFETDQEVSLDAHPYLQIDLKRDTVSQFFFTMMRRMDGGGGNDINQLPADINIYATNNPASDEWERVGGLHSGFPAIDYKRPYASPLVVLPKPYRYLRFEVCRNVGDLVGNNGYAYFNLSEFQLYTAKVNTAKSAYYQNEQLPAAVLQLTALCSQGEKKLQEGTFDDTYRAAILEGIARIQSLLSAIRAVKADASELSEAVYTVSGRKAGQQQRNCIYVQKGRKFVFK